MLILIERSETLRFLLVINYLACSPCAGELLSPSSNTNIVTKSDQTGPVSANLS